MSHSVESPDVYGSGPLAGVRVLDISALGPGPFCSSLLADYGADVVSVERPQREPFDPSAFFSRGKRSVVVDLRADGGAEVIRRLAGTVDVFLESYRPGAMERRGLGPELLLADNPRLIYARLTGYGQSGPYAGRAGHDINYIATAGALGVVGQERPIPPLNLLGDFASGSMNAVIGILLALFERDRTGRGQIVDAAMVDGAALLISAQLAEHSAGLWPGRGAGLLSGAAPFYSVYQCQDGRWFAVGAIEDRFYTNMLAGLGLDADTLPDRDDESQWSALRKRFAEVFAREPRDHWEKVFADLDGCGAPVLDIDELASDPHLAARGTIQNSGGRLHAAPAPRFGADAFPIRAPVTRRGEHTYQVLRASGFSDAEIADFRDRGALVD